MSHRRDSGGDVVHVIPTNNPPENWIPIPGGDTAVWATEDDYNRAWAVNPDSSADTAPPSKKTRGLSPPPASNRARAIGKMFFKTKLCGKFRAGTCPYISNCNFAHSVEELRRPPMNWQEIVAAHDEDEENAAATTGTTTVVSEPREEFQIPSLVSSVSESGRSYKGRHCKKFFTGEGCPYGDSCTFLHDEASRSRESFAISLGPGGFAGGGSGGGSGGSGGPSGNVGGGGGGSSENVKPSNWKTRICHKWEITGYCSFGTKCHFAHGAAELHRYGGGLVEGEAKDGSLSVTPDAKQTGGNPRGQADAATISHSGAPNAEASYHAAVPSQRPSSVVTQKLGIRTHQKWKGPAKISRIYGDWIDENE